MYFLKNRIEKFSEIIYHEIVITILQTSDFCETCSTVRMDCQDGPGNVSLKCNLCIFWMKILEKLIIMK